MNTESHDPRDIPILTDAVEDDGRRYALFDTKTVHAAIVSETLNLADSLLHQAAKDIEAALFERVFDQLRAQLPELVDRVLREHSDAAARSPADPGS
jgi:Zn-dependent M32 family carboxypeptidase